MFKQCYIYYSKKCLVSTHQGSCCHILTILECRITGSLHSHEMILLRGPSIYHAATLTFLPFLWAFIKCVILSFFTCHLACCLGCYLSEQRLVAEMTPSVPLTRRASMKSVSTLALSVTLAAPSRTARWRTSEQPASQVSAAGVMCLHCSALRPCCMLVISLVHSSHSVFLDMLFSSLMWNDKHIFLVLMLPCRPRVVIGIHFVPWFFVLGIPLPDLTSRVELRFAPNSIVLLSPFNLVTWQVYQYVVMIVYLPSLHLLPPHPLPCHSGVSQQHRLPQRPRLLQQGMPLTVQTEEPVWNLRAVRSAWSHSLLHLR